MLQNPKAEADLFILCAKNQSSKSATWKCAFWKRSSSNKKGYKLKQNTLNIRQEHDKTQTVVPLNQSQAELTAVVGTVYPVKRKSFPTSFPLCEWL